MKARSSNKGGDASVGDSNPLPRSSAGLQVILQARHHVRRTRRTCCARSVMVPAGRRRASGWARHLDHAADSGLRLPAVWQQFLNAAVQVRWQPGQHIPQIAPRVMVADCTKLMMMTVRWPASSLPAKSHAFLPIAPGLTRPCSESQWRHFMVPAVCTKPKNVTSSLS